ncbi:MAG TPA: sterol desaturase family protein [Alphaproteobacteria bacterium]|nr:sterol desaturase family protein [Alphaproteobacteria bacterium]
MDWARLTAIGEREVGTYISYWMQGTAAILSILLAAEILLSVAAWWTYRKTDTPRALVSPDAPANFVLFVQSIIIDVFIGNAAILGALVLGSRLTHWHIPFNIYTIPLYFLAAEFWHYIYHRLGHESRLFWADHSIHHSSRKYEFFTSWRLTPFTWAYKAITAIPLAMLGFGPVAFLLMAKGISFQTFIHTNRIGRMGWFDTVFCSPTNHGLHHACNPQYIDKNYGGMTVLWDRLLGTFMLPNEEPIKFGITKELGTYDPFKIVAFEFKYLLVDLWHAPGLKAKMVVLFGKPGETYEHARSKQAAGVMAADTAMIAAE